MVQEGGPRKGGDGPIEGKARDLGIMKDVDAYLANTQPEESTGYRRRMEVEQMPYLDGEVADVRVEMSPEEATRAIREKAIELGADLVGFARLDPSFVVRGRPVAGRWAVSLGLAMDHDAIATAPEDRSGIEVTRRYYDLGRITVALAKHIRSLGHRAMAHHPRSMGGDIGSVLHKPIAHLAGLGEIGRNTLLITPEFGPRVRLATVSTGLEVVPGSPMSIGIAEYCDGCTLCLRGCPTGAIPEGRTEVSLTGEEDGPRSKAWRLDYARCLPYFVETDGCAICIKVCAFNQPPGKAKHFIERALGRRVG